MQCIPGMEDWSNIHDSIDEIHHTNRENKILKNYIFKLPWWLSVKESACIFLRLILCCFVCYYFLPIWGLSFHLAYNSIEPCILSRVKQITSPGWMHETSARAWCTGKTQRDRVEREVGEGIGMGNTCKSMADSCQCMAKTTTIL